VLQKLRQQRVESHFTKSGQKTKHGQSNLLLEGSSVNGSANVLIGRTMRTDSTEWVIVQTHVGGGE
jgi:hypothetical protein